jgi:aromatic ring-opening dioxygenase catalytic subunit (LigB family)
MTDICTVSSGAKHPLLFDYGGFPAESYRYTYNVPGSPQLANQICQLLTAAGIPCAQDSKRGWYPAGYFRI